MSPIKQITLFGATGFVGRHLVRQLAKTGAVIRVPTRDPDKVLVLRPMGNVGQIVPIPCSVRNENSVAEAIGDSDVVINLIGVLAEKGQESFQAVHLETAARIARLAKEKGAKQLVHMSALGADINSTSSYARSKAAGEQAVRVFFPDAVIMRPSIVFGPEDHFFNLFATMARYSPFLPLIGGGKTKFQPIYVGDVATAFTRALASPACSGKTYELGGASLYSFRELMELMLKVTGQHPCLINLPCWIAKIQAAFLEKLPHQLLTRDQVELLKTDNVVKNPKAGTLRDLGITPTSLEMILPTYMDRFR